MSNKISASNPAALGLVGAVKSSGDKPLSSSIASAAPAAPVDTVSLTGDAVRLQQLASSSNDAASSGIDAQRVAQTRAAIASGNYTIDAKQIAAKLTRMDWDLGAQ